MIKLDLVMSRYGFQGSGRHMSRTSHTKSSSAGSALHLQLLQLAPLPHLRLFCSEMVLLGPSGTMVYPDHASGSQRSPGCIAMLKGSCGAEIRVPTCKAHAFIPSYLFSPTACIPDCPHVPSTIPSSISPL